MLEKEKMPVTSIFSLSHNVLKGFFLWVIKSQDFVVKSYTSFGWVQILKFVVL